MESIVHIRPRFEIKVNYSPEEMQKRLEKAIAQSHEHVTGKVHKNHIVLDIIPEENHFWSPHMTARVEPCDERDNKAVFHGVIGPKPNVWTMMMFFNFALFLLGFVGSCYGYSKSMVGEDSLLKWALPVACLIYFVLSRYNYGERQSGDQIEILKDFVREVVN